MATNFRLSALMLAAALIGGATFAADAPPRPPMPNGAVPPGQLMGNSIKPIKGNLYRASNGIWHSIFLVGDDGILLVDPINVRFATWLKQQLDTQFHKSVKTIIYSHSHFDHAEGAGVFAGATIIAYEGVKDNLDGRYPNMPGDMVDRNGNGVIDRDDIMIPTNADPGICGMSAAWFDQYDRNHDGVMTPAELQQDIVKPTQYYQDKMALAFGGEQVQLFHPGKNHGDDMTVVYFPREKVVFATDMMADALVRDDVRSLPSACGAFDHTPLAEWIRSYKAVEALDFDIFAGGHGGFFSKADMALPRQFLEDLQAQVKQAMAAGQTPEQMKKSITLEKYKDWAYFDKLHDKVIVEAYNNLKLFP
ncbi:MAG TPA: MBL fold metallo-hydrolase [Candidatus Acidoferrum sp.]|nr:MBL fold metallo-hydrolase [Candidatus Acidoferrum sp.]